MDKINRLALEQLHQDNKRLIEKNEAIEKLLTLLVDKDLSKILPEVLRVKHEGVLETKADAVTPVSIDGDVKAVVDGGSVNVLNFGELEAYFMALQIAFVEAIAAPQTINPDVPINIDKIDTVIELLNTIADKDLQVTVEGKGQGQPYNFAVHKRMSDALAVRLVTADGKQFYTARGPGSGGGNGVGIPDRLIDDASNRLRVITEGITLQGNVESAPTFKRNPADDLETPKYAIVNAAGEVIVELNAAALAALENITATVNGPVALDAATLAALETVGLDAATLAALETISVGNLPTEYPLPAAQVTALTPAAPDVMAKYRISDEDEASTTTQYYGFVSPAGDWYIMRVSGGSYRYANASNNGTITSYGAAGTGAWATRETLTYALLYNLTGL